MKILAIDDDGVAPLVRCDALERGVRLGECHRCSAFGGYHGHDLIRCSAPKGRPVIHMDDVERDLKPSPLSDLLDSDMDGGDQNDDEWRIPR